MIKASGTIADLALPLLLAFMIDKQLPLSNFSGIVQTGIIMLILSILGLVTNIYSNYTAAIVSQNFARDLRNALFSKTTGFSLTDADAFGIPSLINRINSDVNHVQNIVLMMLRVVIRAPILLLGGIAMTFILDPILSLVLILTMPVLSFVIWYGMKKIVPVYQHLQKSIDLMILVMRENLQGLKVIRALSTEELEMKRFKEATKEVKDNELISGRILAIINPGMTLVMNIGLVATVWFGGVRVSYGAMQTGEIVAFVNYFLMILNALLTITRIIIAYTKAVVSANRVEEVLLYETKDISNDKQSSNSKKELDTIVINSKDDDKNPSNFKPDADVLVCFENVSFTYPGATKEILRNVSFEIKKGQTFAIIGSTGSGKTSVINLMLGLYPATSGRIWFDGKIVGLHNSGDLRNMIHVVFQDPMLFSQSIENNLRWGNETASNAEIHNALEIAQASDFVDNFNEKEKHLLSQGGKNLSGGQRQRIAIARAILGSAPLLILDDSSSALDAITEANLRQALETRHGGSLGDRLEKSLCASKTLVVIAQKICSIREADQILVLEEGCVDSIGTHQELLQSSAVYKEIVDSQ